MIGFDLSTVEGVYLGDSPCEVYFGSEKILDKNNNNADDKSSDDNT